MEMQTLRQFGPYILLKRIGMGGMAELYLAVRQGAMGVKKLFALKCILSSYNDQASYIRLFYHEAWLSMRLQHPNVMATWDCGPVEGRHVMAMEFLRGVTLQEILDTVRIRKIKMPIEVAVEIAIQALDGLQYLHDLNDEYGMPLKIVHRDVSPQNIFACYDGHCKIFDFGVARYGNPAEDIQHGMIVGKVAYMSPEQCRGGEVDGRSDTFALAAVLYEMATGEPVFLRENDIRTLNAVTIDPIEMPTKKDRNFPVFLSRIIMQGLQRDPEQRYPSAYAFADDLRTFLKVAGYSHTRLELIRFLDECFGDRIEAFQAELQDMLHAVDEQYRSPTLEDMVLEAKMSERLGSQELMPGPKNLEVTASRLADLKNVAVSSSVLSCLSVTDLDSDKLHSDPTEEMPAANENRVMKGLFGKP